MSSLSCLKLEFDLKEAGIQLLALASCIQTTQLHQLLTLLDQVDELLSQVDQAPSRSMEDSLYPVMKALKSDQLLKHSDINVKVMLASCMNELTRITAPDSPYEDSDMKEIFQLTVEALGMLSSNDNHAFSKALKILNSISKVRSCLLMLDLECDKLVADIFKQFLSTIRFISLHHVFRQMEYIMTLTLEESEEIPDEPLLILLSGVTKNNENVLSNSWRLAEKVLVNCAIKLRHFLPKVIRSRNLKVDDYSNVVASIYRNAPKNEHVVAEEADPSAVELPQTINNGIGQNITNGTLKGKNSLITLEHFCQLNQQGYTEAERHLQPEKSDTTQAVPVKAVKAVTVPKKRDRKPSSARKPGDQFRDSVTDAKRESFKEPRCLKNLNKIIGNLASDHSALIQEESVTKSCITSSKHLSNTDGSQSIKLRGGNSYTVVYSSHEIAGKTDAGTNHAPANMIVKEEIDNYKDHFDKDSIMPHGTNAFGANLIGRRILVWWPMDKKFYEGAVASFDPSTQMHKVLYADGDEEILNLTAERWKLMDEHKIARAGFPSLVATSHKSLKKRAS